MLKKTKTRESVLTIFENSTTPLSAYDIYENLKNDNITLSSIYRTLDTFSKENIIIKDTNNKGTAIYALNKDDHCHYLECKSCHKKIKLDYCPYHKVNEQIKKKSNFFVDEQNVVIYGTCESCISNKKC